jgi:ferredoxin
VSLTEKILGCALTYFDVAGFCSLSYDESALILGLESTTQRNLDEFDKTDVKLFMTGFARYVGPGLDLIIDRLRDEGVTASSIGKYGYTLRGSTNFIDYKQAAIKAGLGKRGKNTLVISPVFGSRLRFAALKLNTLIENIEDNPDKESPFCQGCSICIDECPIDILEPYRMLDTTRCLSNITGNVASVKDNRVIMCDICINRCPANRVGMKA